MLIALLSWAGLLLFTGLTPPGTLLTFIPFFLIVTVALTSTVAPIAYKIGQLFPSTQPTIRTALRQGALFALIVVLNLILLALRSWNVFTAILIALTVIVVEVIILARK
jgi:hypothetical protein